MVTMTTAIRVTRILINKNKKSVEKTTHSLICQSALYIAQYVLNTHAHPQKLIEKMKTPWRIQLPLYSEILRTTKVERKDVCIMHVLTTILDLNADRSSYSVLQLENYNRIRQVVGIANLKLECIESFENLDQACIEAFVALIEMFETKHLLCESERIAATLQFLSAAHSDPANYANIICTVTGVSKSVEKEKPVKTVTTDWTEMPDMSFATLLMACEYSHSLIKAKTWAQIAQHGLANLYALAVDGYEDQYTETNSSNYTEPSEEEEEDDRV